MSEVAPQWCLPYLRIPYLDRGRTREGLDCYGILALVSREVFGRTVPDYVYQSSLDEAEIGEVIESNLPLDWVKVESPEEGDLIMFNIAGRPWHCGVWVADNLMLHVIDHRISGIDRLDSVRWHRRVAGFYRLKSRV